MIKADIIIIGAGAAGLAASRELIKTGKSVIILEANSRTGGRINTQHCEGFSHFIEAGAEFIHGDLEVTKKLIDEFGLSTLQAEGNTCRIEKGKREITNEFIEGFDEIISKLRELSKDIPFIEFLDKYFSAPRYKELRSNVIKFAGGFDAADVRRASSFALLDEWENNPDESYRIENGYSTITSILTEDFSKAGGKIYLSHIVKNISWERNKVDVTCSNKQKFSGAKVLITIPIGVLLSDENDEAKINFNPVIPAYKKTLSYFGYGTVIKFFFEFDKEFFTKAIKEKLNDPGFILSDVVIPTWWTQSPKQSTILTGWIGGPEADKLKHLSNEQLLRLAAESLSYILNTPGIFNHIKASKVFNWYSDPFARGAYSYVTVDSFKGVNKFSEPVEDTIYFAGEAIYNGSSAGTVEAALVSGLNAANQI